MNLDHAYRIIVVDDVRKPEKEQIVKVIEVKAGSPGEAMQKMLKSSKPYTGVYY